MAVGGVFVAIDGPSGSGKSSVARVAADLLVAKGYVVKLTKEPTTSSLGAFLRAKLDHYSGLSLSCLVAADRYHHLETVVRPAIERGEVVITDRYYASSLVLQAIDGVPNAFIQDLNAFIERPDLLVLLQAPAALCAERIRKRGSHGRFHTGIGDSIVEVNGYRAVRDQLQRQGWNILELDSELHSTAQMSVLLGEAISGLYELRQDGNDDQES